MPDCRSGKSPLDEIIYNASHTGRAFGTDNKEVHSILDELALAQIRRIGLRLIFDVIIVEQLGLHCVNTMMAPRNVTNLLRCHLPISIRPFTRMGPLSPLRDTQLVLNKHLTPFGRTTNIWEIVRRSRFCWSRSIQITRSLLLASKSVATATVPTSMTLWLTSVHRLLRSSLIVSQDIIHVVVMGRPTFVAAM